MDPHPTRAHLLRGVLACVDRWDEVGAIVIDARDREEAGELIRARIGLDAEQVSAFLDQLFGSFTRAGVQRMRQELGDAPSGA